MKKIMLVLFFAFYSICGFCVTKPQTANINHRIASAGVTVSLNAKLAEMISIKDFGAKGDGVTDDTTAIQNAANYAFAASPSASLFIPQGVFKITSAITIKSSVMGISPEISIIYNTGTGNGFTLGANLYYVNFKNFAIKGNSGSQDGFNAISVRPAGALNYCRFENVYFYENGRHGLYMNNSWGTSFFNCKFHYNGAYGCYASSEAGYNDNNGVSFTTCEFRWNGGTGARPYTDVAGGLFIEGAASVNVIGGIAESNNPVGIRIGDAAANPRNVKILGTYFEYNANSTYGANVYTESDITNVSVENCWLAQTVGYQFYFAHTSGSVSCINNLSIGAATVQYGRSGKKTGYRIESAYMGDTGASGASTTISLGQFTNAGGGQMHISGTVYTQQGAATETFRSLEFVFIKNYGGTNFDISTGTYNIGTHTAEVGFIASVSGSIYEPMIALPEYYYGWVSLSPTGWTTCSKIALNETYFEKYIW